LSFDSTTSLAVKRPSANSVEYSGGDDGYLSSEQKLFESAGSCCPKTLADRVLAKEEQASLRLTIETPTRIAGEWDVISAL
jgi:hypothetical protein